MALTRKTCEKKSERCPSISWISLKKIPLLKLFIWLVVVRCFENLATLSKLTCNKQVVY